MSELKERHPTLMIPQVFTFGVVIYHNGAPERPHFPNEAIRQAIIAALPPGCGVGSVTSSDHGVYEGPQGATRK